MTPNPAFNGKAQSVGGYIDDRSSPYICPLVGLEMNDRSKFCFLWKCGCVISERGLNLGADNKCVNCVMEYEDNDIVILNPTDVDSHLMKTRLAKRKDTIKSKKNKIKQEIIIKKEPIDEVKYNKSSTTIVKTENSNIKVEIKKEDNIKNTEYSVKKDQTKSMHTFKNIFLLIIN